jgi:hypothetical protein
MACSVWREWKKGERCVSGRVLERFIYALGQRQLMVFGARRSLQRTELETSKIFFRVQTVVGDTNILRNITGSRLISPDKISLVSKAIGAFSLALGQEDRWSCTECLLGNELLESHHVRTL